MVIIAIMLTVHCIHLRCTDMGAGHGYDTDTDAGYGKSKKIGYGNATSIFLLYIDKFIKY